MYYEEFEKKDEQDTSNNEFVDGTYEEMSGDSSSDDEPSKKSPKNSGRGPFIALIIAILVIGFGICSAGIFLMLKSTDNGKISSQQKTTEVVNDIGSTQIASNNSAKYSVVDVSGVVEDAMPSVVAITNTTFVESSSNDIYDFYFGGGYGGNEKQEQVSAGSGFIVDQNNDELLIVTNNHVVEGADKLAIQFYGQKNKETVKGTIKGTDKKLDVAVVSVKISDIKPEIRKGIKKATLGDSNKVKVGNGTVAIGNALGFGQSVTAGVVSAVNRDVNIDNKKMSLIQTDASINGGNSGGALLNQKGEVIGINVAKYSSSGSSGTVEGMGFAIPISTAKNVIAKLEKQKSRTKQSEETKGYMGIKGITVNDQDSETYSIPKGVLVREVTPGEGADKAGIKTNDVITELDGTAVETIDDLIGALDYYKAGETVKVKVAIRASGYKSRTLSVTLSKESKEKQNSSKNGNNGENFQYGDEYGSDNYADDYYAPW